MTPQLFHYSCSHGAAGIQRDGVLKPHCYPGVGWEPLVWMTDLDVPFKDALGLTSQILKCDRTKHRFEVAIDRAVDVVKWTDYARGISRELRRSLEAEPGSMPMHWWVSPRPVPVIT